jgi:hypothetical protein
VLIDHCVAAAKFRRSRTNPACKMTTQNPRRVNQNELCDLCKGINIESISRPYGYRHAPNFRALYERRQCTFCVDLAELIDPDGIQEYSSKISGHPREVELSRISGAGGIRLVYDNDTRPGILVVAGDVNRCAFMPLTTRTGAFARMMLHFGDYEVTN